jgi:hypothetical protein
LVGSSPLELELPVVLTGPVATSVVEPSLLLLVPSSVLDDEVDVIDIPPLDAPDPLPVVVAVDVPSDVLVLSPPSSPGHPANANTIETTIARSVPMQAMIPSLQKIPKPGVNTRSGS